MELYTTGIKYHKSVKLPVSINPYEDLKTFINSNTRYKVVLAEKGGAIISLNEKKILVRAPSLLCLNETDTITLVRADNFAGQTIYFHPGTINSKFGFEVLNCRERSLSQTEVLDLFVLNQFFEKNRPKYFPLNQAVFKRIGKLFKTIHDKLALQNEEFWPCKSRAYLIELLFLIRRIYEDSADIQNISIDDTEDGIDDIVLYLHSNYEKKISIGELTKKFFTNRSTLSDSFKKKTGMTVMEYLRKIRIDIACQMLRGTSCSVQDIMERTGFADQSNFARVFKKITGYNPARYRSLFFSPPGQN